MKIAVCVKQVPDATVHKRLDPATKRPVGEPLAVRHFHSARGSMTTAIADPGQISPSVGRGRIVFSLGEMTGNIWSTSY